MWSMFLMLGALPDFRPEQLLVATFCALIISLGILHVTTRGVARTRQVVGKPVEGGHPIWRYKPGPHIRLNLLGLAIAI